MGAFGLTSVASGVSLAGAVGVVVTLVAMRSNAYALLAERYRGEQAV